jgi:uncharacterized RDD family membrane protein YckC
MVGDVKIGRVRAPGARNSNAKGTTMSVDNPYAPPQADIGVIPELAESLLADRGTRFVAALVDSLIDLAYSLPLMFGLGFLDFSNPQAARNASIGTSAELAVLRFLFFLLVHGYTLKTNGQTLGKKMTGIRIADLDGGVPDFGRVVGLRYLPLAVISMIPIVSMFYKTIDVLFIFRSDRRCIHDLIAGTKVVKVTRPEPEIRDQALEAL